MSGHAELTGPALVLRSVDYGEADSVVTLLTRDHGRIGVFAKGARSTRRPRFGGALEPFTVLDVRIRLRPGADLGSLTAADPIDPHPGLRADFDRIAWASYAVELAREGSREGEDAGAVYRIVTGALRALADRGTRLEDRTAFELALLAALGFAPRLDRCTSCGREPRGARFALSPTAGGLVCDTCTHDAPLSSGTVRSLAAVAGTIPPEAPRVSFTEPVQKELAGLLPAYVEAVLGKRLNTRAFLESAARL